MDANARIEKREKKSEGIPVKKVLGAYGGDILNDMWERLLSFADGHDLSKLNTLYTTPKNGISHTFNGRGSNRKITSS